MEARTGTKGRRTSHGGASELALPYAAAGKARARARAPARQAGPGRSSLRLAFVQDPAPAPHVGPEPGRGGGFLGRPAGRIPGGPELSLCGNAARFALLALTSRGALPGPAP